MIVLLRLRSLMLISLVILSVSFIYVGVSGLTGSSDQLTLSNEPPLEIHEPIKVSIDKTNALEEVSLLPDLQDLKQANDFFADFRMKRERGRDAQIELLREIVNNPYSSEETRTTAQFKLIDLADNRANEIKTENILRAKGYEEIVVVVENAKVTVVTLEKNLNPLDIARIGDLIIRSIEVRLEDIAIIPKE